MSITVTPYALAVGVAPASTVDPATGKLSETVNYEGTHFPIRNIGTVDAIVFHYSTGLNYPGILYSDTLGQSFNMTSPKSVTFAPGELTIAGGTHFKTAADLVSFKIAKTGRLDSAGRPIYHLGLTVESAEGAVELVIDADLDNTTSTIYLPE